MNTKGRLPTYVSPHYRDDRSMSKGVSQSRNQADASLLKSSKLAQSCVNETATTQDYTKRKVRRGHFQSDDEDEFDMVLTSQRNRTTNAANRLNISEAASFEVGYW